MPGSRRRTASGRARVEKRGYQYDFAETSGAMRDVDGRERKARTMVRVLLDHFGAAAKSLEVLDVGASTGIIDNYLADHFGSVLGCDIDAAAIAEAAARYRKPNLAFRCGDAMHIERPDASVDVVICTQVYEHVPDAGRMMAEIRRVLRPGGACYFAASNRLMWNEPHYDLPLLSVVPRWLAHRYVRLAGKADRYHELHFSYWGLRRLVRGFEVVDYTRTLIERPEDFATAYMIRPGSAKSHIARLLARYALWAVPGYIWLLVKPTAEAF